VLSHRTPMQGGMKHHYWALALTGLALGIGIPLMLGGSGILPVLARFPVWLLAVMLLMIFVGWNMNAGRMRLLAGGTGVQLTQRRALAFVVATEFAYSATPGGSGGPATYAWLLRPQGIPGPRAFAMYAADQLIDMIFFITSMALLFLYWMLAPSVWDPGWQLMVMGGILLGGLMLIALALRFYRRVLITLGRVLHHFKVKPRTRMRLARWAIEFRHSLQLIRSFSKLRLAGVLALCSIHWLLRYSVLYLAVWGLGADISWSYAFVVQMVSLTTGHATLLPGGSGGAEASSTLLLAPYLEPVTAGAAIIIWRLVTFYWYLIAGGPVFAALAGGPLWRRLTGRKALTGC